MARTETKTRTLYQYDELSESAQTRARDWLRDAIEAEPFELDFLIDDLQTICNLLGFELDTETVKLYGGGTRQKPQVYWSGFSSQGDGLSFTGRYRYRKGALAAIRKHAPQDDRLHQIARDLQAVQRRHFYRVSAGVRRTSHHYSHEHTVGLEYAVFESRSGTEIDLPDAEANTLIEAFRDLMRWAYRQLEAEYDYQMSDEQIVETIKANEYEFTEDGARA